MAFSGRRYAHGSRPRVNTARSIASALPSTDLNTRKPDTGSLRDRMTTSTRLMPSALKPRSFFTSRNAMPGLASSERRASWSSMYGAVVARIEERVLLLEVEQRARADRDDELLAEVGGIPEYTRIRAARSRCRAARHGDRPAPRVRRRRSSSRSHARDLAHRPREILARDDERRRDAHHRAVRVLRQDAALEQPVDDMRAR